jgi:hypothetical protein
LSDERSFVKPTVIACSPYLDFFRLNIKLAEYLTRQRLNLHQPAYDVCVKLRASRLTTQRLTLKLREAVKPIHQKFRCAGDSLLEINLIFG